MRKTTGQPDRVYRVISDQLGSPVFVVNIAQPTDVWLDATYDAWGNVRNFKLDGVDQGASLANWPIPHGFAGGLLDVDTGLVRFGARDYDPVIGRWTARDPILFEGGQANLYVYVGNSPVGFVDVQGLEQLSSGSFFSYTSLAGELAATIGFSLLTPTAALLVPALTPFAVPLIVVGTGLVVFDQVSQSNWYRDTFHKTTRTTNGIREQQERKNRQLEEVLRESGLSRPDPVLSKEGQESCDEVRK